MYHTDYRHCTVTLLNVVVVAVKITKRIEGGASRTLKTVYRWCVVCFIYAGLKYLLARASTRREPSTPHATDCRCTTPICTRVVIPVDPPDTYLPIYRTHDTTLSRQHRIPVPTPRTHLLDRVLRARHAIPDAKHGRESTLPEDRSGEIIRIVDVPVGHCGWGAPYMPHTPHESKAIEWKPTTTTVGEGGAGKLSEDRNVAWRRRE